MEKECWAHRNDNIISWTASTKTEDSKGFIIMPLLEILSLLFNSLKQDRQLEKQ